MSELERLIQKYCSNGVEYKALKDLCLIETGKLNANAAVDEGEYAFFTTAKTVSRIDKYRWDTEALLIAGNANVGDVKHYTGKFEAYQRTYVLTEFDRSIVVRYLYYCLSNNLKSYLDGRKNEAAMTYIVLKTLQDFEIPIPPLPVQQAIVRILDTFTELTAELTAELDARKKQYDYYRDELLTFGDDVKNPLVRDLIQKYCPDGVEYRPILNVLSQPITDGPHETPMLVDDGVPFLSVAAIHDGIVDVEKCQGYISLEDSEMYRQKYRPMQDDVYMVKSASVGKVAIVGQNVDFDIWSPIAAMRCDVSKMLPRFLFYVLQINVIQKEVIKKSSKGSQPNLSMRKLEQFEIPVPPLPVQREIVHILDNFSSICTDISSGLPAEIEARMKQYEYYRDMLLNFKRI